MQVKDVPLPGKLTRFDYASLDEQGGRLYFSHMNDGDLVVFDTKSDAMVTNMPGFHILRNRSSRWAIPLMFWLTTRN